MEFKTIKVSSENYKWLARLAAEMQKEKERPISLDEALTNIKIKKKKLSSLAGTWKITEEEAEELKKSIRKGWSSWKIKSA